MNQKLFVCVLVCMCIPVCKLSLSELQKIGAFSCMHYSVCLCLCVLVRRGLNAARSLNCNRNTTLEIVFFLIAVCQVSDSLYLIFFACEFFIPQPR